MKRLNSKQFQHSVLFMRVYYGVLMVIAAILYLNLGNPWYLLLPLAAVIDITMLGYLKSPRFGAFSYNIGHSFIVPFLLFLTWLIVPQIWWLQFVALIWTFSIALARSIGFGLKFPQGYGLTHLGVIHHKQFLIAKQPEVVPVQSIRITRCIVMIENGLLIITIIVALVQILATQLY